MTTICLLGNASELISHTRRAEILEAVDPLWSRYGSDELPSSPVHRFVRSFRGHYRGEGHNTVQGRVNHEMGQEGGSLLFLKEGGSRSDLSPPVKYGAGRARGFFRTIHILPAGKGNAANQGSRYPTTNRGRVKPPYTTSLT